jgi:hypothetical protein
VKDIMSIDYRELLTDLEAQLAGIEDERAKLETKQAALLTTITGIRQLINLGVTTGPASHDSPKTQTVVIPKNTFRGMNKIVPGAIKYLRLVGEPKKNRELVDGMIAAGFPTKADDPYTTFRSVLYREMRANRTFTYDDKMWGLPEWKHESSSQDSLLSFAASTTPDQSHSIENSQD